MRNMKLHKAKKKKTTSSFGCTGSHRKRRRREITVGKHEARDKKREKYQM